MAFPTDAQRGLPAWLAKFGPMIIRARYRSSVGDSNAAGKTPLIIQGAPSQTANLVELYDSAKNHLFHIDKNGLLSTGAEGVVRGVTLTSLTAAQINGMSVTPVAVVPTPPAGTAIVIEKITVQITTTATQFANGGVVHFYYHGATTEIMSATIAAATVQAGAGVAIFALNPVSTAGGSVVTKEVGIDITNATGAFDTGTGTMKIWTAYQIVTL